MEVTSEVLYKAKNRVTENGFPYAGALTPVEVYDVLQNTRNAVLVDVRTHAELELVGKVPDAVSIEWAQYPGMVANTDFSKQLEAQVDKGALVVFMCRTGGRSHHAALLAAQLGFTAAYNMLEGFEGKANPEKQRTLTNGWRHADLPWHN